MNRYTSLPALAAKHVPASEGFSEYDRAQALIERFEAAQSRQSHWQRSVDEQLMQMHNKIAVMQNAILALSSSRPKHATPRLPSLPAADLGMTLCCCRRCHDPSKDTIKRIESVEEGILSEESGRRRYSRFCSFLVRSPLIDRQGNRPASAAVTGIRSTEYCTVRNHK